MTRRMLWAALLIGAALSLVVSYRIAARSLVLGSAAGGWSYEYLYGFQPRTLVVFAVVCVCCAVLAAVPLADVRRYEWRLVLLWVLAATASQGVLRSQTPYTMEAVFVSDGSNGFYSPTRQYSASVLLRNFDGLRTSFSSVHAKGNMPGKLMFVYALEAVSERPAVLVWLVIAISNLGGVLLYAFVRDFLDDAHVALLSMVFYLFVPAKLYFLPVLNTVTPVFAILCAWLWLRWIRTQAVHYAALLGAALYLVVFFEPTPLVMGLLFVGLTAQAVRRREIGWRTTLVHGSAAVVAFAAVYALLLARYGFDLLGTFRQLASEAAAFNAGGNRPYWTWVWRNPLDFFFGAGVCQATLFCACVAYAAVRRDAWIGSSGRAAALSVGVAASLIAVDLIGLNRGEVVRLWIFLACFVQIPAACVCAQLNSRAAVMLVLATSLLQSVIGTSMLAFAQP